MNDDHVFQANPEEGIAGGRRGLNFDWPEQSIGTQEGWQATGVAYVGD